MRLFEIAKSSLIAYALFFVSSSHSFAQTPELLFPSLTQEEREACPAGWGLDTKIDMPDVGDHTDKPGNTPPGTEIGRSLVHPLYRSMETVLAHSRVDGKTGRDTMKVPRAGFLNIDGATVISFEIIKLENDKPNAMSILAPGLATLDEMHAEISGDAEIDTVSLDGCLNWEKPIPIAGDDTKLRYFATDASQKRAIVDIGKDLKVERLTPFRLLGWRERVEGKPLTEDLLEKLREFHSEESCNSPQGLSELRGSTHFKTRIRRPHVTARLYHADCIYGFLASFHTKQQNWSYQRELAALAESFIEAGYPNLARIIVLKMIGGSAVFERSLDTKHITEWLPLMLKIEQAESGTNSAVAPETTSSVITRLLLKENKNAPETYIDAAQESADAGNFDAALAYAKEIGSEEYK